MILKIPGKIFISGEYAALRALPAITVAVEPSFTFQANPSLPNAFHPQSPAGLFNANTKGEFIDPYKGVGGMGRSTAEFLAAASTQMELDNQWDVWAAYRNLFVQGPNTPSGVDLLTQMEGGYCVTDLSQKKVQTSPWPFPELDWIALITGNKTKTHEHLSKTLNLDWEKVEILNQAVVESFRKSHEEDFISALNTWREFLFDSQLEVPATTELVEFFMDTPGVKCVKGCGALGSDVALIVFDKGNSEMLERAVEFWNPDHVIRSSQVCFAGLEKVENRENFSTL